MTGSADLADLARPLLWDLDGTIADTSRDIATAVNAALVESALRPLALERVLRNVGNGVGVLMQKSLLDAGWPDDGGSVEAIEEAVARFRRHYALHLTDTTVCFPGMESIVHELARRGRRMAVVSNKPEQFTRQIIDRLGLASCFLAVLGGDSLPRRKPDPDPLLLALRLCRGAEIAAHATVPAVAADTAVDPATAGPAIVIGDSLVDVQAARSAGLPICGVAWGFDPDGALRDSGPDWYFETPAELGRALLGPSPM